jgi:hypothetical protein
VHLEVHETVQDETAENAAMRADDVCNQVVASEIAQYGIDDEIQSGAGSSDDSIENEVPVFAIQLSDGINHLPLHSWILRMALATAASIL